MTSTERSAPVRALPRAAASFQFRVCRARVNCSAGAKPKSMLVTRETPILNANTQPSKRISSMRGMRLAGANWIRVSTPQRATMRPSNPPMTPSTALSVSSCRARRQRVAPSDARMAISCLRADARESNRLATFTQAISSTQPTAPRKTNRAGLALPTTMSRRGAMAISVSPCRPCSSAVTRALAASSSAFARATVAPAASLPIAWRKAM